MRKTMYETSKSVKQRFALRKLSVGVLSVLIGFTTLGGVMPVKAFAMAGPEQAVELTKDGVKISAELQKTVDKWKNASVDSYIYETNKDNKEVMDAFTVIKNDKATVTELEKAVSVLDSAVDTMVTNVKSTTAKSVSPEVVNKLYTLFPLIEQDEADEGYTEGINNFVEVAIQNGHSEEAKAKLLNIQKSADAVMDIFNNIDKYKATVDKTEHKNAYKDFMNFGNNIYTNPYDTDTSVFAKEGVSGAFEDAKLKEQEVVTPIDLERVEKGLKGKITIDAKYGEVTKDGIKLKKGLDSYTFKLNISQTKDFKYYENGKVAIFLGDTKLSDDVVTIENGEVTKGEGYFITFGDGHVSFYTDFDQYDEESNNASVVRYGDVNGEMAKSREVTVTIKANDTIKKAIKDGDNVTRFTVTGERKETKQTWESNASFINGDAIHSTLGFVTDEVIPENPDPNVIPWTPIQPIPALKIVNLDGMEISKDITEEAMKISDEGLQKMIQVDNPTVKIKSVKMDRNFKREVGLQKIPVTITFDNGSSRIVEIEFNVLGTGTPSNPDVTPDNPTDPNTPDNPSNPTNPTDPSTPTDPSNPGGNGGNGGNDITPPTVNPVDPSTVTNNNNADGTTQVNGENTAPPEVKPTDKSGVGTGDASGLGYSLGALGVALGGLYATTRKKKETNR